MRQLLARQEQRWAAACVLTMIVATGPVRAEDEPEFLATAQSIAANLTELPLALVLNGEARGDVFVRQGEDGDLLIRANALADRGIPELRGAVYSVDSKAYVSLRSIKGARFEFDERNLVLQLTLPPEYFAAQTASLRPGAARAERTEETSAFLNYRLGWQSGGGVADTATLASEAAARTGPYLLRTEQLYSHSDLQSSFVRFQTQLLLDQRDDAWRWVAGDSFASSGELGSTLNLGGLSFSKAYQMTPYFIRYPMASFAGAATLPSDVEVYIGDTRVYQDRVAPGPFQLNNLNYYGGRQDVRVLVRDALGQVQVYAYPYYFSSAALGKGVQEYSYAAGWLRENYGVESNSYGPFGVSALHRYGVTDHFTLGIRGEYASQRVNLGPLATLQTNVGTLSVAVAASRDGALAQSGSAGSVAYAYQYGNFNTRVGFRGESAHYALADPFATLHLVQRESLAGIGYSMPLLGNLDLQYTDSRLWGMPGQRAVQAGYSHALWGRTSLFGTLRRQLVAPASTEVFVGLSMALAPMQNFGAFHTSVTGAQSDVLQASGTPGPGEGLGYRFTAQREQQSGVETSQYSPYLEYNARYGTLIAQDTSISSPGGQGSNQWQAAVQGSVETVRHTLTFGRRIDDSFAIAQVEPPLAGVRVYHNNQEIGRTDAHGKVLIQDINAFIDNPIAIDDQDVPIEYSLRGASKVISPPYRSGSVATFELKRSVGVAGHLRMKTKSGERDVEYHEAVLEGQGVQARIVTGTGGEFYVEDLAPGDYRGALTMDNGKDCVFVVRVPEGAEPVIELDKAVVCEMAR